MFENMTENEARLDIQNRIAAYYGKFLYKQEDFRPGNRIPYAARVFDEKEICTLVDSCLDFWLTSGRYTEQFESAFAGYLGVKHACLVNSGSSANLLAFQALTAPELGERRIAPGDEVITVAAGFPTTVAPIIQYGAIPVFVDVTIPQYNVDCSALQNALSRRTRAVMLAHTMGNPFDLNFIREFCDQNGLWLIEDNCDALGSEYRFKDRVKLTGTIGHIGTSSFYPPHHMTMGEGGCVYTDDPLLNKLVRSFRDWGRDCCCPPGVDNFCRHRYDGQYGELPPGYDHKYTYSHFGFNLKATDMQAAIGCEQLKKLPGFVKSRRENWSRLRKALECLQDRIILPEAASCSEPSWFGFLITIRKDSGVRRDRVVQKLEEDGIQTRMLFAGNLIKHPCFDEMRRTGKGYRVAGGLENTDTIMMNTFWLGVYPGMTDGMLDYMSSSLIDALDQK